MWKSYVPYQRIVLMLQIDTLKNDLKLMELINLVFLRQYTIASVNQILRIYKRINRLIEREDFMYMYLNVHIFVMYLIMAM